MKFIILRFEKTFLKYYRLLRLGVYIILGLVLFYFLLQRIYYPIPYISPSGFLQIIFPTVELLVFTYLYHNYLNGDRQYESKIKAILSILVFNTLFFQLYYQYYFGGNKIAYQSVLRWYPLAQIVNFGLIGLTGVLLITWRKYVWKRILQLFSNLSKIQQTSIDSDDELREKPQYLIQTNRYNFISSKPNWIDGTIQAFHVFILWLILAAKETSFTSFLNNEVDALPSALQFVNPGWLPNDWYLNLDIGYRQPFNLIAGSIVSWLGFKDGAIVSRSLLMLLLAFALFTFFKAIHLRQSLGIVSLFVFLNNQSLAAGEWIVQGVDTKTIAYSFILLSFAAFLGKRYLAGFAFSGAALSFHILVGIYGVFCLGVAILFNQRISKDYLRRLGRRSWAFIITGLFGLLTIIEQILQDVTINSNTAWEIYVNYRLPHHLIPRWRNSENWIEIVLIASLFFLLIYLQGHSRPARFVAAFSLASLVPFTIGLIIYEVGAMRFLRYYWFRFPDVMVPLMGIILVALLINGLANGQMPIRFYPQNPPKQLPSWLIRGTGILIVLAATYLSLWSTQELNRKAQNYYREVNLSDHINQNMFDWIAENTPTDAVFLIDPTINDFYIYAQRAIFVSYKHMPQSAPEILEWFERLRLTNGGEVPTNRGVSPMVELNRSFYALDEDFIMQIAESYGIRYYLGMPEQDLSFEQVQNIGDYTLYKIDFLD